MNPGKTCLLAGALYGVSGVVLGAWGTHGLTAYLGHGDTGAWDTAVQYQLIHALGLLLIGIMIRVQALAFAEGGQPNVRLLTSAGWLMIAGVPLFSGSIYLLVLGASSWFGPVTPIGGSAFIFAWICLLVASLRWH